VPKHGGFRCGYGGGGGGGKDKGGGRRRGSVRRKGVAGGMRVGKRGKRGHGEGLICIREQRVTSVFDC
jgi:hypothetical protein